MVVKRALLTLAGLVFAGFALLLELRVPMAWPLALLSALIALTCLLRLLTLRR